MTITRWDPFREMTTLQNRVNRLFSEVYGRTDEDSMLASGAWMPPVDVYETPQHELVIKAELPDMRREDIQLTVENNTLTLRGERGRDAEVKEEQFHRVERAYGTFSRSFTLPPTVDSNRVTAEYKHGVLTIRLPLREEAKPKQIQVEVAA